MALKVMVPSTDRALSGTTGEPSISMPLVLKPQSGLMVTTASSPGITGVSQRIRPDASLVSTVFPRADEVTVIVPFSGL